MITTMDQLHLVGALTLALMAVLALTALCAWDDDRSR